MISTQSTTPTYLAGTPTVPGVQGVQSVQGVQGMPAQPNAFGINPAGNGVQSFAPQTPPTQAWATQAWPTQAWPTQAWPTQAWPTTDPTNAAEINAFVGVAFNKANELFALSATQQAQQPQAQLLPQQQLQIQQPQTLAQPQATPTTVAPSASVAGLQVPTQPTAPATPPLQAGQSDGNGNILVQMPQTGQLAWVPEAQLLAMYQKATTAPEQLGKVQLPNGQWVSKATAEAALARLQALLTLKRLKEEGKISDDDFYKAGGTQDLKEVLAAGQKSQADKARARREEMKQYAESTRASIQEGQNPYASLGGTGGGGADVGSIG
jgi:hypothetical protein